MISIATDTILEYLTRERDMSISESKRHIARLRECLDLAEATIETGAQGKPWRKGQAFIDSSALQDARYWSAQAAYLIDQVAGIKLILQSNRESEIDELVDRLGPLRRLWFNTREGVMIGGIYRDAKGDWFGYTEDATLNLDARSHDARNFIRTVLMPNVLDENIIYGVEDYR